MSRFPHYFSRILAALLISFTILALSSCGMFSNDGMGFYEDKEDNTPANQSSGQPETSTSNDSNSDATEVPSPDGTYKWTQTFIESNYSSTPAFKADTAIIVMSSDGTGMINDLIPCRISGDELLIEWSWDDKGNTSTVSTLKITTVDEKKHLEGTVKTSNPDGFYTTDHWVMDEN